MKIKGLTIEQLQQCADKTPVVLTDQGSITTPAKQGNFYRFTLRPTGPQIKYESKKLYRYQRRSINEERKVHAVCWHGHRDFMKQVFAVNPDAIIVSSIARYNGLRDFLAKFPETGYKNIGSQMYPMQMQDACFCEEVDFSSTFGDASRKKLNKQLNKLLPYYDSHIWPPR